MINLDEKQNTRGLGTAPGIRSTCLGIGPAGALVSRVGESWSQSPWKDEASIRGK